MFIKRNHYIVYKTLLKLGLLTNLYNKNEKIYNKTLLFSYRRVKMRLMAKSRP